MYSVHMLQILTNGWGDGGSTWIRSLSAPLKVRQREGPRMEVGKEGPLRWRCEEGNKLHTAHTPNGMRAERATTTHRTALTDVIGV